MNTAVKNPAASVAVLALLAALAAGTTVFAADAASTPATDAFQSELAAWKTGRETRLHSPDGWLTLIGLAWLKPGANAVGSAKDAVVQLPAGKAPALAGTLTVAGDKATFAPAAAAQFTIDGKPVSGPVELRSDANAEGPTVVTSGSVSFYLIVRNEKLAVRIKDSDSPTRKNFTGVESFPTDPSWRVIARFEPYPPGKTLQVPTVLGTVDTMPEPGALTFERNGHAYRLDAVFDVGDTDYFIIFGDQTNRKETYGGGRFLYAKPADANGNVILDFNRAYNPPCVFTPYATCPLPPPQNKLQVRVEAGEKMYGHGFHD